MRTGGRWAGEASQRTRRFSALTPGHVAFAGMRCVVSLLSTRGYFHRAGPHRRPQRTRSRHRPRQQHLRGALTTEIAIRETHARHRSAEVPLVLLVEVEARLERKAPDRGADGLAADLKRIAGKAHVAHRTGTGE